MTLCVNSQAHTSPLSSSFHMSVMHVTLLSVRLTLSVASVFSVSSGRICAQSFVSYSAARFRADRTMSRFSIMIHGWVCTCASFGFPKKTRVFLTISVRILPFLPLPAGASASHQVYMHPSPRTAASLTKIF